MSFISTLDVRHVGPNRFELLNALVWATADHVIEVPAGFVTDLASVPRLARPFLDINGRSAKPAVLHDWLYTSQTMPRGDADALFLEALRAEGVRLAGPWIYWAGVRVGGWVAWRGKPAFKAA